MRRVPAISITKPMSLTRTRSLPFSPTPEFLESLQLRIRPRIVASLVSRGASESTAEDVASEVLSECFLQPEENLLRRFPGSSGLEHWLLRVAINRLISLQRRERFTAPWPEGFEPELEGNPESAPETALRDLVFRALCKAVESLPPGHRVLLWLRYGQGIPQNRLCVCWRCNPAKLSRRLAAVRTRFRDLTMAEVHKQEPGLQLKWEDIVSVCAGRNVFFA